MKPNELLDKVREAIAEIDQLLKEDTFAMQAKGIQQHRN